jgi:ribonuclease HI
LIYCEALAILRALEVAGARGFRRIKIRSDHNPLRKSLRNALGGHGTTRPSGISAQILAAAAKFAWVAFGYVPRRKNQIAHRLANAARRAALLARGICGAADGDETAAHEFEWASLPDEDEPGAGADSDEPY